jgi:PAS domain S-box-containing protein
MVVTTNAPGNMSRVHRLRESYDGSRRSRSGWLVSLTLFCLALIILLLTVLAARLPRFDISSMLLGGALAALCVVLSFLFGTLWLAHRQQCETASALDASNASLFASEKRFRQMADHIQEIFWMIDAHSKKVLYVNRAYETITGRSREALRRDPLSCAELIHPEDRDRILAQFGAGTVTEAFSHQFRIVLRDGDSRWIWVGGFPVRDGRGEIQQLVGTARDVTAQKQAEAEIGRSLAMARGAWAEADALRKATLALTQDLQMDNVLDTLLESLLELVPYESAQILLVESDSRLFVARDAHPSGLAKPTLRYPVVLDATDYPLIGRVLQHQDGILLPDTQQEQQWRGCKGSDCSRSWLGVPLLVSHCALGLFSLSHSVPNAFTPEHLRLAKLLAIPAAAAIQNARMYECAKIYGAALEKQTSDLRAVESALQRFHGDRTS